jgi:hypothetical protein
MFFLLTILAVPQNNISSELDNKQTLDEMDKILQNLQSWRDKRSEEDSEEEDSEEDGGGDSDSERYEARRQQLYQQHGRAGGAAQEEGGEEEGLLRTPRLANERTVTHSLHSTAQHSTAQHSTAYIMHYVV